MVAVSFGLTVTIAGGVRHLGRFIEDGELDTLLTQPRPVLLYALGMRSQASGVGDVLSGLVFIATSGEVAWHTLPLLIAGASRQRARLRRLRDCVFQPRVLAGKRRNAGAPTVGAADHVLAVPGAAVRRHAAARAVHGAAGRVRRLLACAGRARAVGFAGVPAGGRSRRRTSASPCSCSIAVCVATRPAAGSPRSGDRAAARSASARFSETNQEEQRPPSNTDARGCPAAGTRREAWPDRHRGCPNCWL